MALSLSNVHESSGLEVASSQDHSGRMRWRDIHFASGIAWRNRPRLVVIALLTGGVAAAAAPTAALIVRGFINALAAGNPHESGSWLLGLLGLMVIAALAQGWNSYVLRRLQEDIDVEVGSDLLRHAADLEYEYFENRDFHDAVQRAREDSSLYVSAFFASLLGVTTSVLTAVVLSGLLAVTVPQLLIAIVVPGAAYFGLRWQLARRLFEEELVRSAKFRWNYYFSRALTEPPLVTEVRLLGLESHFVDRFRTTLRDLRDRFARLLQMELLADLSFGLLSSVVVFLVLREVVDDVIAGQLTVGDVGLVGAAGLRLRGALQEAIAGVGGLRRNLLHIRNVSDFLALSKVARNEGEALPAGPGRVSLRGITFTYPGASDAALNEVTLEIEPGETLALVGENGSGKSTIAKLITGLYRTYDGRIQIDGVDVNSIARGAMFDLVHYALQDVNRFEASAADTLAYGDWERLGHDRQAATDIAVSAGVDELIDSWPRGYDTRLGLLFGEHMPSAGQWQQLALARAFARPYRVLILDEPTASLDVRHSRRLVERLCDVTPKRTTLLISHQWPTIRRADRIAVLDKGRIVEIGSHDQLTAARGHYWEMFQASQLGDVHAD